MGIKVKWQPIDWSMKETELNTGNIDAIWNGYTVTKAREKQVAFSKPYHKATQVLVTLKKNNVIWAAMSLSSGAKRTAQNEQSTTQTDDWARIKKAKQITIGLDDTFVPMGFRDKDGNIVGFDVDLATN
ncbi:transporter substrate-binding domain-containing protein|uniref:Transporter substrate-binding domain-containing protein n=1 Tax=Leuconostoc lactis TaxID=1246 RepID=A0A6L7AD40_LEULA|nr:transporter substrate-binding domain-containing protein [Leuconostoc lactis]